MNKSRHCTCCDQMLSSTFFPRDVGDCNECCAKRFLLEMFESPKSEEHLWKFRKWTANVYDTKSLLEEESEYLHVEILQKNLRINLGIKKRATVEGGPDDEFLIWVGDRQFVIKSTNLPDHQDNGVVMSNHAGKEILH